MAIKSIWIFKLTDFSFYDKPTSISWQLKVPNRVRSNNIIHLVMIIINTTNHWLSVVFSSCVHKCGIVFTVKWFTWQRLWKNEGWKSESNWSQKQNKLHWIILDTGYRLLPIAGAQKQLSTDFSWNSLY